MLFHTYIINNIAQIFYSIEIISMFLLNDSLKRTFLALETKNINRSLETIYECILNLYQFFFYFPNNIFYNDRKHKFSK